MQGQVIVLVVSIDEEPSGLIKELSRLGVEVLFGALSDCEQMIDEHQPDLVVLFGARGAMELASLIEGHEGQTPPRMVIAADRKELAKMIGLNRDVVVSLFATESGDRVLGQRIESLARRAARRRTASIPPPSVKATQVGLPNAGLLNKLELKKSTSLESPGRLGLKSTSGEKVKSEPLRSLPFVEATPQAVDREAALKEPQAAEVVKAEVRPEVKKAPRAESIEVADDDLLSLRPSEFPDAELDLTSVPTPAAVPVEAAAPPTFPPSAQATASTADSLASATDDDAVTAIINPPLASGFDISGAEAALENLENLLAQASKPMVRVSSEGTATPFATDLEASRSPEPGLDPLAATLLTDVGQVSGSELPDADVSSETPEPSHKQPPAVSMEEEATHEPGDELRTQDHELPAQSTVDASGASDRGRPPDGAKLRDEPKQTKAVSGKTTPQPQSKSKVWWLPAVLIGAAIGLGLYLTRTKPAAPVAKETVASREQTDLHEPSPLGAERADSEQVDAQARASADPSLEQADTTALDTETQAISDVAVTEDAPKAVSPSETTDLEQPFVVVDTKQPSCEVLLSGDVPQAGRDLVHQASLLWGEARKLIVAGKVADAHKKMCGAVILNPDSAAVEGLAQLYLDMFSLEQAEHWANKAEQLRPGQRDITVLRGDIHGMRGELDKARDSWRTAFKLSENGEAQLRAMSRDYGVEAGRRLRSGDIIKAEIWYRRAAILDPGNLAALMGLANTFMRSDRPSYALAFAQRALAVSELIPEMQVLVGEIALKSGQMDEARARFEKALAIRSDFYPAKRGLSLIK